MIVTMRREKPTWGARKLRKLLNDVRVPACSTIHAIMDRHGLVTRQRHSRTKTEGTPYPKDSLRRLCGAPTTRASSCSGTRDIATPLPSRTTPPQNVL
jgi:hypothetical protein